jgi:hypothetical protein
MPEQLETVAVSLRDRKFFPRYETKYKTLNKNYGWGTRTRTWECRDQNPVPYQLGYTPILFILMATNQQAANHNQFDR